MAELGGYSSRKSIEQMTKMGYELNPVDDDQLFMISGALSYGLFEMVRHDVPKEKAKENMLHLLVKIRGTRFALGRNITQNILVG